MYDLFAADEDTVNKTTMLIYLTSSATDGNQNFHTKEA